MSDGRVMTAEPWRLLSGARVLVMVGPPRIWSSTSRSSSRSRRVFQVRSNVRTQSWMGFSAGPLTRYQRCRPSTRTSTRPTARSTPRCLDTCGWLRPSRSTSSPTVASPVPRASRRSRRLASATALNASAVVGVRAMATSYSDIGICQRFNDRRRSELGGLQVDEESKLLPGRLAARREMGGGPQPVGRLVLRSTWRATVTLCTSVGPSASPMTSAPIIMRPNGISFDTPSAPWSCIARCTTSWMHLRHRAP